MNCATCSGVSSVKGSSPGKTVALMQRGAKPGDAVEIAEVERHQGRAAAVLTDLVVELFEAALRPRHRHDMRTGFCKRARGGIADAARGAGHVGDTGGEGRGHWGNSGPTFTASCAGLTRVSIDFATDFHETMGCRVKPGNDKLSTRFRQQRKLTWLRLDLGLVGQVGRMDTGKATIREVRAGRTAAGRAHRAVHAVARQE